jgi:hypothetical protein
VGICSLALRTGLESAISAKIPGVDDDSSDRLRQQFDAHAAMLHTFYEWRHKIMTRFAVSIAAVILGLRWAYGPDAGESALAVETVRAVLLAIGAVLSLGAAILDVVNQRIINNCYQQGSRIEKLMKVEDYGLFQSLAALFRPPWMSYRVVLRVIYGGSAASFGIACAWVLWS